jgi:hypothetical protein
MTILQHVQKAEKRRRALLEAQYTNAKAYRGVSYENFNAKTPRGVFTYRGVVYNR